MKEFLGQRDQPAIHNIASLCLKSDITVDDSSFYASRPQIGEGAIPLYAPLLLALYIYIYLYS